MTVPSHHDIITGLQQRDPQTVSWIYETYGPRIYHYLCRRLGDPELARDAHSDVFVRLLERAAHYEDRGLPLTAWLFHLARDQAASMLRRDRRLVPLEDGDSERNGDPEALLAHQWDWEHLQQVLAALPDHYRQVLWLRFGYALSLEATAQQLGCTVSAVKALQHRAMTLARKLVREQQEIIPNLRRTYTPPMA
ncbi:sigma-70 family RNA polymerase sigma factor [Chloroflexus sp.]|uniref:RNA polymerase sigma factor n=1 Tax=Chloroflexus sp. TaxID=1904827 RepID=UPI002ACE58A4|nr:sigma-70 family RNA polymerase sigma factor [Chloroflexus sp.]